LRKLKEKIIEIAIKISGVASIFIVAMIFLFLLKEGGALFKSVGLGNFLLGKNWYPISEPGVFGILPLIAGTVLVTFGAALISMADALALPFGIEISIDKGIPLGSGLGGSAASAVAAVVAEYGEQRKLAIEARDHLTAAFEALWSEMEEEYLSEK